MWDRITYEERRDGILWVIDVFDRAKQRLILFCGLVSRYLWFFS